MNCQFSNSLFLCLWVELLLSLLIVLCWWWMLLKTFLFFLHYRINCRRWWWWCNLYKNFSLQLSHSIVVFFFCWWLLCKRKELYLKSIKNICILLHIYIVKKRESDSVSGFLHSYTRIEGLFISKRKSFILYSNFVYGGGFSSIFCRFRYSVLFFLDMVIGYDSCTWLSVCVLVEREKFFLNITGSRIRIEHTHTHTNGHTYTCMMTNNKWWWRKEKKKITLNRIIIICITNNFFFYLHSEI